MYYGGMSLVLELNCYLFMKTFMLYMSYKCVKCCIHC